MIIVAELFAVAWLLCLTAVVCIAALALRHRAGDLLDRDFDAEPVGHTCEVIPLHKPHIRMVLFNEEGPDAA